ncbi:MAG: YicC/YloC family endoribonuclease [Chitinophagales bacterium]
MLYSMTGYGKAVGNLPDKVLTVEIRSVNSKSFDVSVRLPQLYRSKELILRKLLSNKLLRGKIDVYFTVEDLAGVQSYTINKQVIKSYFKELADLSDELSLPKDDLLTVIMRIPDILTTAKMDVSSEEWERVMKVVEEALTNFQQFRKTEGDSTATDLKNRVESIQNNLSEIEALVPERMATIKDRIQNSLNEIVGREKVDMNRFEQELIYYLEKLDINEEVVRLTSHCTHFLKELEFQKMMKGKKLGFIAQEMGREINTIGSKANHAKIQSFVIQMKDDLEKIKEQLLNIV